jgi:hypothetical protein
MSGDARIYSDGTGDDLIGELDRFQTSFLKIFLKINIFA